MAYYVPVIFIETPVFTRQITTITGDEQYAEFQWFLAENPLAGDVIKNTGGLRKVRIAASGRGKRGGARVIYYYFVSQSQIVMLLAYEKNDAADLSTEQKKILKAIIENWKS